MWLRGLPEICSRIPIIFIAITPESWKRRAARGFDPPSPINRWLYRTTRSASRSSWREKRRSGDRFVPWNCHHLAGFGKLFETITLTFVPDYAHVYHQHSGELHFGF